MPALTITLIEGYDDATKTSLAERLTDAVRLSIGAPLDGITIMINEVTPSGYMRGRRARTPGTPPPDPAEVVRSYLTAMEARDLAAAAGHLAENFSMIFPGNAVMRTPEELAEWARDRYRAVRKVYERFDVAPVEEGAAVYCFGTLEGEWPDGTPFAGIRFIDRFTVAEGRLMDQRVWNDMGETMLSRERSKAAE